jgi:hypothetical protein
LNAFLPKRLREDTFCFVVVGPERKNHDLMGKVVMDDDDNEEDEDEEEGSSSQIINFLLKRTTQPNPSCVNFSKNEGRQADI